MSRLKRAAVNGGSSIYEIFRLSPITITISVPVGQTPEAPGSPYLLPVRAGARFPRKFRVFEATLTPGPLVAVPG